MEAGRYAAGVRAERLLLALVAAILLGGCAKDLEREQRSRIAVRSLVAAPDHAVEGELNKVVALGHYALMDIEQVMHAAPVVGRLRLLRAMERIGSPEAIPLLRFLALRDTDDAVRRRAAQLARTLQRIAKK